MEDDIELTLCIHHSVELVRSQPVALFIDASQQACGALVIVVELLVARLALTESHVLDVGNEHLHKIVC